jgi:uncharacterized protein YhaN
MTLTEAANAAMTEIDSLRRLLAERDTEIERLKAEKDELRRAVERYIRITSTADMELAIEEFRTLRNSVKNNEKKE